MRSSAHDDVDPISGACERTSPCVSRPCHRRPALSARSARRVPRRSRPRCRRIRRSDVLLDDRRFGARRSRGVCRRVFGVASQGGGEGGNPALVAVCPCNLWRPLLRIPPLPLRPRATAGAWKLVRRLGVTFIPPSSIRPDPSRATRLAHSLSPFALSESRRGRPQHRCAGTPRQLRKAPATSRVAGSAPSG
jgi:hypothetical protein